MNDNSHSGSYYYRQDGGVVDDANANRGDWIHQFLLGRGLLGATATGSGNFNSNQEISLQELEKELEKHNLDQKLRCQARRESLERECALEEAKRQGPYYPPPHLRLTEQELTWAWDIRTHINNNWETMELEEEDDPHNPSHWPIQRITDYEVALYAVARKDDTLEAISQIEAVQRFKRKYWITDTVQQGIQAIQDFMDLLPGDLLSVDHHRPSSSVMIALDCSKYYPAVVRASEKNTRIHMLGMYYLTQICAPTLDVLRSGGVRLLIEATGFSSQNMDQSLAQQTIQELRSHLPLRHKEVRVYNTNPLLDGFFNLMKPFLPTDMREVLSIGCRIDATAISEVVVDPTTGTSQKTNNFIRSFLSRHNPSPARMTLPSLFLQPDYHTAMQQNLIPKIRSLLEERYQNERSFRLCVSTDPGKDSQCRHGHYYNHSCDDDESSGFSSTSSSDL